MTSVMTECLLNKEAITINQDHMSAAGKLVGMYVCHLEIEKDDKVMECERCERLFLCI